MNRDELRKLAAELNISGRGAMSKAELEQAVTDAQAVGVTNAEYFDSAMLTPEYAHRMIEDFTQARRGHHKARTGKRSSTVDPRTPRRVVKAVRANASKRYGQNGRGEGLKHLKEATYRQNVALYGAGFEIREPNPDAERRLSYGDRIRHYARQNGFPRTGVLTTENSPVLTARQWRRANHKAYGVNSFNAKTARYPDGR